MSRPVCSAVFLVLLLVSSPARAQQRPELAGPGVHDLHGGNPSLLQSARDTVVLIGPWSSAAPFNGQFENQDGMPAWNGWTHQDLSVPQESRWRVSDYQAGNLNGHGPGNLAAWCGEAGYAACSAGDEPGGYGNNYDEILGWSGTVADPGLSCTVTVDAWLNLDLEAGYDYFYLRCLRQDNEPLVLLALDGRLADHHLQETFLLGPDDYLGEPGARNRVELEFRVTSDSAYSDEDCFFPSAGACQIDDITVTLDNGGTSSFEDFQSGEMQDWRIILPLGVGDFAQILYLDDIDPCVSNYTPQVCFIDDGQVVPGTGGQYCINWCYGPNGYIVNTTGGLAGPDHYLHNRILSPVVPWPASGAEGGILAYGVFEHEDLSGDSPGIFHTWHVRSTASGDPADLASTPWQDRNYIYYGRAAYRRGEFDITDLLVPGTTHVQVSLDVQELGYLWGFNGDDGYPAPYFDNVRLAAFPFAGPSLSARRIDLAQDGFPAAGILDQENPANNNVRFDMARNIALVQDMTIIPGDSLLVTISPRRPGAVMAEPPRLFYYLAANPAFDPYRDSGLGNEGYVEGIRTDPAGVSGGRFAFDLPDSGFFFPGDVLHYYIQAVSDLDGNLLTSLLPADTTGFNDFAVLSAYAPDFTVRALPSVSYDSYHQDLRNAPDVLLWDDGGDQEVWVAALEKLHLVAGHFDIYRTAGPSSAVGNGLGSRATPEILSLYRTLLYTCGSLGYATICNGDLQYDGSDDAGLLDAWMDQGGKSMFLTGDNLVADLFQSGAATQALAADWLRTEFLDSDVRYMINAQVVPRILAAEGPVFPSLDSWIAYGGCPVINTFDALTVAAGGQRIAEFTDPGGIGGAYIYSAATLNDLPDDRTVIPEHNSAVISLPYDFSFVYTDPAGLPPGPLNARETLLHDVLMFFGEIISWGAADMPGPRHLEARSYPNPFNPNTKIEFHLPRTGRLTVKLFNIRGELVRTLVDEERPAGPGSIVWAGDDDRGAAVSSGVYFCQVKAGGEEAVHKIALVK